MHGHLQELTSRYYVGCVTRVGVRFSQLSSRPRGNFSSTFWPWRCKVRQSGDISEGRICHKLLGSSI